MPRLVRPSTLYQRSWLEAAAEPGYQPRWADGVDLAALADPQRFTRYVDDQLADADEETPRPRSFVPSTHLWYVDGEQFLGRLSIRHRLNAWLHDYGGHVGYDVRPSARRRGYATLMLRESLPWAARLGIDPALVTCDTTNDASRKVIEAAGGVFENEFDGKLRYWVPTA